MNGGYLPADAPKTDRELLLQIYHELQIISETLKGPDGNSGLCAEVRQLQRDRWYLAGAIAVLLLLVTAGRLSDLLFMFR
jgi:hypothetical protein